jgi:hypothetical protein
MSDTRALSLEVAHEALAWPSPDEIKRPSGAGASVFADLVRSKVGRALKQFSDAQDAVIGVLMADPGSARTEPPLAVVVEFQGDVSEATLRALQRLVWNFSHSPAVITLEPGLLRVWTCCEPPDESWPLDDYVVHTAGQPDLLESASYPVHSSANARSTSTAIVALTICY